MLYNLLLNNHTSLSVTEDCYFDQEDDTKDQLL